MNQEAIELFVPFEDAFGDSHREAIISSLEEFPDVPLLKTLLSLEAHQVNMPGKGKGSSVKVTLRTTTYLDSFPKDAGLSNETIANFILSELCARLGELAIKH